MSTSRQKFIESYSRRLFTHAACNPGLYEVPTTFAALAEENVNAILSGKMEPGVVFLATLKEFGAESNAKILLWDGRLINSTAE